MIVCGQADKASNVSIRNNTLISNVRYRVPDVAQAHPCYLLLELFELRQLGADGSLH